MHDIRSGSIPRNGEKMNPDSFHLSSGKRSRTGTTPLHSSFEEKPVSNEHNPQ